MREFVDRMLALLDAYGQVAPQSPQEHAGAARDSLRSAEAHFAAGDNAAGSDRLWQGAVHAVTAVARQRGWPSDGHHAVKAAADRLAAGDPAVIAGFFAAQQFHANATHDFMEPDDVARACRWCKFSSNGLSPCLKTDLESDIAAAGRICHNRAIACCFTGPFQ